MEQRGDREKVRGEKGQERDCCEEREGVKTDMGSMTEER